MQTPVTEINVIFEEVLDRYDPNQKVLETTHINDIEVVTSELDFLPIVVAKAEEQHSSNNLVNEISVTYEIVTAAPNLIEEERAIHDLEVTFEQVSPVSSNDKKSLQDIPVIFEEVKHTAIAFKNDLSADDILKLEKAALFDIEVEATVVLPESIEQQKISEEDIIEAENKDLPQWLLKEIADEEEPDSLAHEVLQMSGSSWKKKEPKMMDMIKSYFEKIPKSNDYNGVSRTDQLLENLEIFGDQREIPLLQEFLKKTDKKETKERIEALMKRFMGSDAYGASAIENASYSVFEELFRNCDTESKLILLDEIVAIGDHKEVPFLEKLIKEDNRKVSKQAKKTLKRLQERLDRISPVDDKKHADEYENFLNMMELMPPQEAEIFDIDFEFTKKNEKEDESVSRSKKGWLSSLFSKFLK